MFTSYSNVWCAQMYLPDEFPRDVTPASLAWAQPKLAARMTDGGFIVDQTEEKSVERLGRL
jgi:hypothetical protein